MAVARREAVADLPTNQIGKSREGTMGAGWYSGARTVVATAVALAVLSASLDDVNAQTTPG